MKANKRVEHIIKKCVFCRKQKVALDMKNKCDDCNNEMKRLVENIYKKTRETLDRLANT